MRRVGTPSPQLIDELLHAVEERIFGTRNVGEAHLQRTIEAIFLRLALNELEHAFRINFILFIEEDVAVAGAGIDFADSECGGAQFEVGRAEQGLRIERYRSEAVDDLNLQLIEFLTRG